MTGIAKLLCELIALPSVNPAFLPANDPRTGEARVAEHLAQLGRSLGFSAEFAEALPGRANLLLRLAPAGRVKHRVLLAPHLDTVPPANDGQLQPALRNGRIYGRGACDTKGCVAAMFSAMRDVAGRKKRPQQTEIVLAALIDEENGQRGSRALAASGLKADFAIVGEPTRLRVVTAHKGDLWLKFVTRGRAAHGSEPYHGVNAVLAMARVVELLETTYAAQLRKRLHPLLGSGTINVGAIHGGTQANIVPDHCEMIADRRTLPGETLATVRTELRALFKKHRLEAELVDTKDAPCVALETDPQHPHVQQLLRTVGQTKPAGANFFCDAAILAAGGIPSVVFGPGDIAQAHTADEWIEVKQLEQGARLLSEFLRSLP
jgi:acetylornithine deacetylase/succinyl-diaminopimelate desuccinylase-like protein